MAMDEQQLLHLVESALENCSDDGLAREISEHNGYYMGELPEPSKSKFLSSVRSMDSFDVVESDMPSLVRTFLGSHSPMQFDPTSNSKIDIAQAEEKTEYINYIIKHAPNSYKVIFDWMKDGLISFGVLKFDYVEETQVKELVYKGINEQEQEMLLADLDADKNLKEVEVIIDEDEEEREVRFKIKQDKKYYKLINIPPENFRITQGSSCLEDAEMVGHEEILTRSDLVQMGYDKDLVNELSEEYLDDKGINDERFRNEGGDERTNTPNAYDTQHNPNEYLTVQFIYMKLDDDDDGIAERRRIVKVGNRILDNEQVEIIPYAVLSSIPVPHKLIGLSRVAIAKHHQKVQTRIRRGILDNIYKVNHPSHIGNPQDIVMDDILTSRPDRFVRTRRRMDPRMAVSSLEVPYIGDKALQVTQYIDSAATKSLGVQSANQGLESDRLYKESATRFQGVQDNLKAKIELVARNYAETGFRQLYEGLAWMVAHYQREDFEIKVLGKQLTIDPRAWRYDHKVSTTVGLAADNSDSIVANIGGLLQLLQQFQDKQMSIVDEKKIYNVTAKLVEKMGFNDVSQALNDPEKPQEVLLAQNEQLMTMVEQLQAQAQQNPLAEAEKINAQARLIEAQAKNEIEIEKIKQKYEKDFNELTFKYDELEAKYSIDIEGKGTE